MDDNKVKIKILYVHNPLFIPGAGNYPTTIRDQDGEKSVDMWLDKTTGLVHGTTAKGKVNFTLPVTNVA